VVNKEEQERLRERSELSSKTKKHTCKTRTGSRGEGASSAIRTGRREVCVSKTDVRHQHGGEKKTTWKKKRESGHVREGSFNGNSPGGITTPASRNQIRRAMKKKTFIGSRVGTFAGGKEELEGEKQ